MLNYETLFLLNGIVALAFIIKATTGFGENLVMIPLALLFLELKVVLPLTLVIVLIADGYLLYRFHVDIHWPVFWLFLVAAFPGIILGTLGLQFIEEKLLEKVLGIMVTTYAVYDFFQSKGNRKSTPGKGLNLGAGFTGGILSGMLGIGGPPVIAYLNHKGLTKQVFRATCIITFLSFDLFRLGSYTWKGYFTTEILLNGLSLIPAFAVGSFFGMKLHHQLNEEIFKKVVAVLLVSVGLILIF